MAEINSRDALQSKIKGFLREQADNFGIRSGGSGSTDITNKDANKITALLDFTKGNQLDREWVFYFGDEFYRRTDSKTQNIQLGNDEVIALEPRLQKVRTLAVNSDDMEGAARKTRWIGRSPQAILEFLEEIIISSVEVAETQSSSPVRQVDSNWAGSRQDQKSWRMVEQGPEMTKYDVRMTKDDKRGGIDMNSIDLERKGVGVDIQFDPVEFQQIIDAGIDGFAPVIINITPLPSILPLLGMDPANKEEEQGDLVNAG